MEDEDVTESFDHGVIEASGLYNAEIRLAIVHRLQDIAEAIDTFNIDAGALRDRATIANVLANLNAAEMHVTDVLGC